MLEACGKVPPQLNLKIGSEGVSSVSFVSSFEKAVLLVGTSGGRVRLYDCSAKGCCVTYQKRWHKSIRCLSMNNFSSVTCISASAQCVIKTHDITTCQRISRFKKTQKASAYSALMPIADHRWATGDDNGFVKLWDDRQKDGICFTIEPTEDMRQDALLTINDLALGSDPQGLLLAAVDNGCLVTYNVRRRRIELVSEPLGYSARAVVVVKNNKKVLVGTDEGIIVTYNWNEFGSVCDRFPVRRSRCRFSENLVKANEAGFPSVEKIVKFTEDIVVIGTDDGALSAVHILPNRMLSCLGWHTAGADGDLELGGDCMSLASAPGDQFMASGLPSSSSIRFWSLEGLDAEAAHEVDILGVPKKRRSAASLPSTKLAKSRRTSKAMDKARNDFLSGLMAAADTSKYENRSANSSSGDSD